MTGARQRSCPTEDVISLLEVVASELPEALPFLVAVLAESPARPVLLELVTFFEVTWPAEVADAAGKIATQLDRLERDRRKWTEPDEVLGASSAGVTALAAFSSRRAGRRRGGRRGVRPAQVLRVERRLRSAAGLEHARGLVDDLLAGR